MATTTGDNVHSRVRTVSSSSGDNMGEETRPDGYSSDSSAAASDEFYDAIADEHGDGVPEPGPSTLGVSASASSGSSTAVSSSNSNNNNSNNSTPTARPGPSAVALSASHMADSGIFSMHSSHVDTFTASSSLHNATEEITPKETGTLSTHPIPQSTTSEPTSSGETELINKPNPMPRPPPRTRKKGGLSKQNSMVDKSRDNSENNGNNSSSADSRSMTNSVESTTASVGKITIGNTGQNLTSVLDDIVSIKGDLHISDAGDKASVYLEGHQGMKNSLIKPELIFSHEQLREISKSLTASSAAQAQSSQPAEGSKTDETGQVINQIMIMNIDTGEKVPLSKAENLLPKCLNPLSLHLMKLTNDFNENEEKKGNSLEKESADTTFKSVTSLISSTLSDIKSEMRDKSLDKKAKKKMKELLNDELNESHEEGQESDIDEEKHNADGKDGRFRSKFRDLKKLGSGLIRGVKGVKASAAGKERSTFHVDLKAYGSEPEPLAPPPPPRYKLKVNHKRGSADFDGLKLVQEINDCKGAIWCMKYSNCSQLLAAAGQDHMLRVYCAQKSWKYFTQLRNKASGQHISPNSTKERSSANGDSFGRSVHRSSFSRSGSLNASDNNSHNNSSSSSSSSAFAKEMYRDEDNTLSEEGPLLLFTIYRGHTADVLDLAWSKNHFLLSASMDKTVRLWHITRIECLCTFRHIDFVTTIQFHPPGSLDGKLRLWNIPEKRVTLWNEVNALPVQRGGGGSSGAAETDSSPTHGLITASSFVQNGKFAVIGTYDGRIIFYTTDQLKYFTQIHVSAKNSSSGSGGSRKGCNQKVTGVESVDDNNKILVTTNDSRLRLYDLRDLSLTCKYKGCINQSSQIKAAISHDHKYIICGSENNSFYIWRIQDNSTIGQRRDRNKQYECIRLLNPPSPPSVTSPIFNESSAGTSAGTAASGSKAVDGSSAGGGGGGGGLPTDKDAVNALSSAIQPLPSTSTSSSASASSSAVAGKGGGGDQASTSAASVPGGSSGLVSLQPSAPHSNAATKIVTSAIFAPVPGQIDDKSKYVIAIADFNGFIRIFSKH
ncbi:hypothetical protein TYRP_008153 [Tyrophagus putrescentiae]|nr:hypothetical protein TYRP_008153 [Tyrophagus putrescentiae]